MIGLINSILCHTILFSCLLFMPYFHAFFSCPIFMPYYHALFSCLIFMPFFHALLSCPIFMPYFHYLSPNNFNFFIGLKSWISIQFWFEVFFFPFCTFIFPVRSVSIYFNIALSKISHINLIFNFSLTKIFALKCFPTNLNLVYGFFLSSFISFP